MSTRKTRTATSLDTGRAGQALARPGMDTRLTSSLAIVTGIRVDPDHGVLCDVLLMPSGQPDTARMGTPYAGQKWGFYFPIKVDDEVLCTVPRGDPNEGLVIAARVHSPSDPLPAQVVANPDDVVLVVEPDKTLRQFTTGTGNMEANSEAAWKATAGGNAELTGGPLTQLEAAQIKLGKAALNPLLKTLAYRPAEDVLFAAYAAGFTAAATGFGALTVFMNALNAGPAPTFPSIKAAAAAATAPMAAAATALAIPAVATTTFTAADAAYLSTKSKTE